MVLNGNLVKRNVENIHVATSKEVSGIEAMELWLPELTEELGRRRQRSRYLDLAGDLLPDPGDDGGDDDDSTREHLRTESTAPPSTEQARGRLPRQRHSKSTPFGLYGPGMIQTVSKLQSQRLAGPSWSSSLHQLLSE